MKTYCRFETILNFLRLKAKERGAATMKKVGIIVLMMLLALTWTGCSNKSEDKIGIRGEITSLAQGQNGQLLSIMVEGSLESDTMFDKASIFIADKTKIIEKATGKKVQKADLKEGQKVEVVVEGPVRESYPVQADAKEIRVLE